MYVIHGPPPPMMFFCHVGIVQIKGTNILEQRFLLSLSMRACKAEAEVTYHVLMRQEQTKVSMHALGFSAEFQHRIAMYVFFYTETEFVLQQYLSFQTRPRRGSGHRTQDPGRPGVTDADRYQTHRN